MAEMVSPITRQVSKEKWEAGTTFLDINLQDVEDCLIYDRRGVSSPFKSLYQHSKTVIIFVRNFLCYSCKDYVDDLSKVPRGALEEAGIRLVVIGQSAPQHIEWEETDTAVKPPGHGRTPKTESNNHKTNQEAHSNIESGQIECIIPSLIWLLYKICQKKTFSVCHKTCRGHCKYVEGGTLR
ncbi:peroxiredoxin-like 2C isoform X2 [Girardinichthys multiradiatus]|uniref:peroxiredoxin-like 2C isoform X2 n=1 Tax=Girardinichthys multiradiatus TaxID=208333 RepID=UPI001FAC64D0|nr:peroxiredoxin-like 2C isoform X2 [Girardinichthys multiradiatus]